MLNHITIMGRLTRDPELRRTQSGTSVTSFTVAVDRDYTAEGRDRETDFIDCVAWRQGGEFVATYFRKGSMIVVDGRLQSRKWQDREGNNRTSWEINADHCYFGEAKRDGSGQSGTQQGSYGSGGYQAPASNPTQSSGQSYRSPNGAVNVTPPTFQELDDDDGDLPF